MAARDDHAAVVTFIKRRLGAFDAEDLERFALRSYLEATALYDVPAEERLRQLAIAFEGALSFARPMREWRALDRVYAYAIRIAPDDVALHASRAISSSHVVMCAEGSDDLARIARESAESLARAMTLRPDDAELHYLDGYHVYMHRTEETETALIAFERAIALDARHGFARLYRAHCLHDLGCYAEAVQAYDEVPKDAFDGPTSWRMDLLIEQRAQCRAKAGDIVRAREDFERLLARYEREPHLVRWTAPSYRRWASEVFPELEARLGALEHAASLAR